MKIDSYCVKKEKSLAFKPDILINLSYNINHKQMLQGDMDISMDERTTPNKMEVDVGDNTDYNVTSTQSSVNHLNLIQEGVLNFDENEDSQQLTQTGQTEGEVNPLLAKIREYIKDYTLDDVEKYNLEKFIMENEDRLVGVRVINYFPRQRFIDVKMRIILLDWVMEVCGQLSFKRSTYHTAVVLIDVYLSKKENLPTNLLQLTGATCLILAAKNEVF
jgi:hypothetical protein